MMSTEFFNRNSFSTSSIIISTYGTELALLGPKVGRFTRFFHLESSIRLLLLCVVTGVVAGVGPLGFDILLEALSNTLLFSWLFQTEPNEYWLLMAIPAVGALIGGLFWPPKPVVAAPTPSFMLFTRTKSHSTASPAC
jgi:hypothetical protein